MDERIIRKLEEMHACEPAVKWVRAFATPQIAWCCCERGDWMLWLIDKTTDHDDEAQLRRLVLADVRCTELVIHLIKDECSREFVRTAIEFSEGRATRAELYAAAEADADTGHEGAQAFADAYYVADTEADTVMLEALGRSADIIRALYPECPKFW